MVISFEKCVEKVFEYLDKDEFDKAQMYLIMNLILLELNYHSECVKEISEKEKTTLRNLRTIFIAKLKGVDLASCASAPDVENFFDSEE